MSLIQVKSRIRDYNVYFGSIQNYLQKIGKNYPNSCYIVDANVWKLHCKEFLKGINSEEVINIPISEAGKTLKTVRELYDRLIGRTVKRNLTIISIGGGITQDVTGFLSSTLYRGLKWIFIPTTFLAQADSCIGSKTSLNYKNYKNLIGTFYPPAEVFIDTRFIATQKSVDFYSGFGEAMKLHVMGGAKSAEGFLKIFPKLKGENSKILQEVIRESLLIKQNYIEEDEFDNGKRNLLNYGHCFGHALETASDFNIPHGQAVVAGMILANRVALRRGLLSKFLEEHLRGKFFLPSLVVKFKKKYLSFNKVLESFKKDKKRTGDKYPVIVITDNYNMLKISDMEAVEIVSAIKDFSKLLEIV